MQMPLSANVLATLGNGGATVGNPTAPQQPQENPGMLQAQLLQQAQQRKLAEALMNQGYVPNSGGLGALAMVMSAYKGKKLAKESDEKVSDYSKRLFDAERAQKAQETAAARAEADRIYTRDRSDKVSDKYLDFNLDERKTPNDAKEAAYFAAHPDLAAIDERRGRARASTTNITVPGQKYVGAFDEALAKQDAEYYTKLRGQAQNAGTIVSNMNRLESALKNVPGGKIQDAWGQIGQVFGTERGATRDVIEAQVQGAVDKILELQPGPKTDQDAARARAQIPNMATNPAARKVVFDFIRDNAKESQRQYKEANQYAKQNGNLYNFTPSDRPEAPITKVINGVTYIKTGPGPNDWAHQ